jgi:hypothetical protein
MAEHRNETTHVEETDSIDNFRLCGEGGVTELPFLEVKDMICRQTVNERKNIVASPNAQMTIVVWRCWHRLSSSKGFAAAAG